MPNFPFFFYDIYDTFEYNKTLQLVKHLTNGQNNCNYFVVNRFKLKNLDIEELTINMANGLFAIFLAHKYLFFLTTEVFICLKVINVFKQ